MKYSEIKDLTVEELKKKSAELRGELFEMNMKNQLGQLGNPLQIRFARRNISRVETALTKKLAQ